MNMDVTLVMFFDEWILLAWYEVAEFEKYRFKIARND